ncbi:MAG: citrate synthase [Tissierellia bacterium]|nr:citrate synthase [Tissierellia bacterium]
MEKERQQFMDRVEKITEIDPSSYGAHNIKRGLRNRDGTGVLVGITNISDVVGYEVQGDKIRPREGELYIRGIGLHELIEGFQREKRFGFEEIIYLLLTGVLPNLEDLNFLQEVLWEQRVFPPYFNEDILFKNTSQNIMNMLQRAVLALYSYDDHPEDTRPSSALMKSLSLIGKLPPLMVFSYKAKRHYHDDESLIIHRGKKGGSTAENILHLLRDNQEFTREEALLLDLLLIVHAEHGGGNNSAFATHVVSSSGTDIYSAITTALGALKGPRHGGANLKVKEMTRFIKDNCHWKKKGEVSKILDKILKREIYDQKGLVYGIGHAVYTKSDPRCVLLKKAAEKNAQNTKYEEDFQLLQWIEELTIEKIQNRKGNDYAICANVDLYSGLIYEILGIDEQLYTPMFAISRIAGWCAHLLEQIRDEKIMRPGYVNLHHKNRYIPIKER